MVPPPRRPLGDDHRAEQVVLALHALEHTDDQEDLVADADRGQAVDPLHPEELGRVRPQHRHLVGPERVSGVGQAPLAQHGADRGEQVRRGGLDGHLEGGPPAGLVDRGPPDQRRRRRRRCSGSRRPPPRSAAASATPSPTAGRWRAAPPRREAADTVTSVAASSSNRPMIWLPAVRDRPSVATSAASPMLVPRMVSIIRPGRENMPANDSRTRSRGHILDGAGAAPVQPRSSSPAVTGRLRSGRRPGGPAARTTRRHRGRG